MHVWFLVLILWLYYCYIITIMNQLWLNTWLAFHSQELAGYRIMRNNKYIPLKKNSRKISVAPYFLIFKSSAINWCIGLIIKCLIHFSQTRNSWIHSSEKDCEYIQTNLQLSPKWLWHHLLSLYKIFGHKMETCQRMSNIWFEFYQQWRVACPIMKSVQTYPKWTSNIQITNISSGWFRLKMRSMKPCLLS